MTPDTIVNPETIRVATPVLNEFLFICTGTAVVTLKAGDGEVQRRILQFDIPDPIFEPESPVPPLVFPIEILVRERVVATMSLASIGADESDVLWAVDWVDADWDGDPAPERHGRILVTAQLAVNGDFGDIFRLSYQVSFVASIG